MFLRVLDTILNEETLRWFILVFAALTGGVLGAMTIRHLGELLLKIFGFVVGGLVGAWFFAHFLLASPAF